MKPGNCIGPAYAKRFDKVFDYIDRHLDDDLSVEALSDVAHFSKYHFHRQFSAYTGVSVYKYVQLMRLLQASKKLAFQHSNRIQDISLEAGFDSPEAFTRAFKRTFGLTPMAFRRKPQWRAWSANFVHFERLGNSIMDVKIVNFPETKVAALEHVGHAGHLNQSVRKFIAWRQQTGLSPVQSSKTYGIPYGNPDTTPPHEFRFDICGQTDDPVPENEFGVRNAVIAGGRCAVVRHVGSTHRIGETIYPLYRDWLPTSGEQLRDAPLVFHYLTVAPDIAEREMQTDIYLPLR